MRPFPPSDYPLWEPPIEGRKPPPKKKRKPKKKGSYGGRGWGFHGLGRKPSQLRRELERQQLLRAEGFFCEVYLCPDRPARTKEQPL